MLLPTVAALLVSNCFCSSALPLNYEEAKAIMIPDNVSSGELTTNLHSLIEDGPELFEGDNRALASSIAVKLIREIVSNASVDISAEYNATYNASAIDKSLIWLGSTYFTGITDAFANAANKDFCKSWKPSIDILKYILNAGYKNTEQSTEASESSTSSNSSTSGVEFDEDYIGYMWQYAEICPNSKVDAIHWFELLVDNERLSSIVELLLVRTMPDQLKLIVALPVVPEKTYNMIKSRFNPKDWNDYTASRHKFVESLRGMNLDAPYTYENLLDWAASQTGFDEADARRLDRIISADTTGRWIPTLVSKALNNGNSAIIQSLLDRKRWPAQHHATLSALQSVSSCTQAMEDMSLPVDYCACKLDPESLRRCVAAH